MNDLIKLQRLDERFRMVCGMLAEERKRAEALERRLVELEEELEACRSIVQAD